ncbi:chemotaxis protein CheW [Anaeromyxobacter paludicola]|uniref:CheW-like domain-containing protein n=1 Tax=Anaeromyxobacter paludicola TaxID=2918171 RepID=A0ABM7XAC4_9BACT|nr:chemotaxis protein CheW [Anaeromyxobacter paludicola]BDG08803.1 hypothetical protein AMPC_19160 [Anaeromyxobacter paludicola]
MSVPAPEQEAAARLRAEFDASFAVPPPEPSRDLVPLLLLRAGGQRLAARLQAVRGLVRLGAVTPVPSRRPEFLGIAGLRGEILPVFQLGRLLGLAAGGAPRWMVLAGAERVGLAFDDFDGYVQVAPSDLQPAAGGGPLPEVARLPDRPAPVLDLAHLLQALGGR